MTDYTRHIEDIATEDYVALEAARESYGDSWKSRGGVGAFMNLSRKWDRLEAACKKEGYDIFAVAAKDNRFESVLNDVRDLRRYLNLVEAEIRESHGPSSQDRDLIEARKERAEDDGVNYDQGTC